MVEIKPDEDGLVRTVTVAPRPRKRTEPADTCRGLYHYLDVGVTRLVLIVLAPEEISEPTDPMVGYRPPYLTVGLDHRS